VTASRRRVGGLLIAFVAGALLAGCWMARDVRPTADNFATWSETPLAPDPNLAAVARDPNSSCNGGPGTGQVQILLQDRRTSQTAAFLFSGPNVFGSCIVTAGGNSSGGSGPSLEPMIGAISIDNNGAGGADGESVRELGGRVAPNAAQVVIQLTDGRSIHASVGNGYWLAWWPDTARAERVVATDAGGAEIASTEVVE
jgi:hypothetical protein